MLAISTVAFYCTITITVMYSFWILRNGRMIFLWGYFESSQQNLQQNNSRTVDSTGQFVPIHSLSVLPYAISTCADETCSFRILGQGSSFSFKENSLS